ncbi:MAG: chromate transporter [Alphaproteobacteria bacterium]
MAAGMGDLVMLAAYFAKLSLLAVGGGNSILPEMYRLTVEVEGWLTPTEFASLFAIAQATPGPNMLIVTLIGWHVAGIVGALTATLALCLPSCTLTYLVFRAWGRFAGRPWRAAIQEGLAPVTVGLVAAGALMLVLATARGAPGAAIVAAIATAAYATRLNPVWLLLCAAAAGYLLGA